MNSTPFRLLWIHQNFVTARQSGNSRPIHIVSALLALGASVDILTASAGYLDDAVNGGELRIEREGRLSIHHLPVAYGPQARSASYLPFARKAASYAARLGPVDVVYSSSPPLPQVAPGLWTARRLRCPLVLEIRDLWPANLVAAGILRNPAFIGAMQSLEFAGYRFADHVIPVAPSYEPYLRLAGIPQERMTVIPTGGDPVHARPDPEAVRRTRAALGLDGRLSLFYGGSLNEYYDFDLLIAAAERSLVAMPELVWIFAGAGRRRPQVEQAAARLPNVRFLGSLAKDALYPLYHAVDVGLVSLWNDPVLRTMLPGKLFDAMAAGLPVLGTVDGQAGAIIRSAKCGQVVAPTVDDLLAGARSFLDMGSGERSAVGLNGQRWVLEHMNAVDMGWQVAQVVEQQVALHRAGRPPVGKALRAATGGVSAVFRGRPGRAVNEACFVGGQAAIDQALGRWLQLARPKAPSLSMPALLSGVDR